MRRPAHARAASRGRVGDLESLQAGLQVVPPPFQLALPLHQVPQPALGHVRLRADPVQNEPVLAAYPDQAFGAFQFRHYKPPSDGGPVEQLVVTHEHEEQGSVDAQACGLRQGKHRHAKHYTPYASQPSEIESVFSPAFEKIGEEIDITALQ
jgi:hypothetical protein